MTPVSLHAVAQSSSTHHDSKRHLHHHSLNGKKILIVQNKGGGHASLGFSICEELRSRSQSADVVLLQDPNCDMNQEPFRSYDTLRAQNIVVLKKDLHKDEGAIELVLDLGDFDYVIDNWSKKVSDAEIVTKLVTATKAKHLTYISSAGMYQANSDMLPLLESDSIRSDNEAHKIETFYQGQNIPFTFFRPQYLYGEKANKRYLDYFIGRGFRKFPIFLPGNGDQLISLTHNNDAARMVLLALGQEDAMNNVFNCVSEKYITTYGLCEIVHDALGTPQEDRKYLFYDPQDFLHWEDMRYATTSVTDYPFRFDSFITSCHKSVIDLGYHSERNLEADIKAVVHSYLISAAANEEWTINHVRKDFDVSSFYSFN